MTVHDEGFEGLRVLVAGETRGMREATAKRFAAEGHSAAEGAHVVGD